MNLKGFCSMKKFVISCIFRYEHSSSKYPASFANYLRQFHEPVMDEMDHESGDLADDDMERYNKMQAQAAHIANQKVRGSDWNRARRLVERGPQEPNILTVAQKRQLIHLATRSEQRWSPDRLAKGFQLSVTGVRKFLRSSWLPTDAEAIRKHDRRALDNRRALGLPLPLAEPSSAAGAATASWSTKQQMALPAASRRANSLTAIVLGAAPPPPTSPPLSPHSCPQPPVAGSSSLSPPLPHCGSSSDQAEVMASVYSRRDTVPLAAVVRDRDSGHVTRLQVQVNVPRRPMTLAELKRHAAATAAAAAVSDTQRQTPALTRPIAITDQ